MLFFIDSIYTERYMNLPQKNPGGYINASITDMTGFRDTDFLLAHGSGDDNVHFANSHSKGPIQNVYRQVRGSFYILMTCC
jgi:dipeptidyl aminopeptidase/acylaminoacyl peptidase